MRLCRAAWCSQLSCAATLRSASVACAHLSPGICSHTTPWHTLANFISVGVYTPLWHHLANLICPHTLLWHHLANLVTAGSHTLFRHHLANLVGAYALFWDHLADLVAASLDPLLLNHFADFVALLFDNGFPLIANTINLLFADFRNPYLFTNCP